MIPPTCMRVYTGGDAAGGGALGPKDSSNTQGMAQVKQFASALTTPSTTPSDMPRSWK